ncbi:DNA-directed RNA polymerases IV and V subunit 2 [Olea europaea subsp. europaea]|uniref:DNA-directed RNA polymerase n=1 Tax=Olea europaea subsp. europaea TaxID=158383 RepID=A0A8S0T4A1_OLEEU|nr:DNA-directed RNA polymerases IV and V subunit 2 [Olea europaea subsp. europaea]
MYLAPTALIILFCCIEDVHYLNSNTSFVVYSKNVARIEKFKTGFEQFVENKVLNNYHSDIIFGRLPVMVKSDLCWLKRVEKGDCEFDRGGYFIIKGAEKEQTCLKRLWLSSESSVDHCILNRFKMSKRLELSGELLEKELRVHIKHAERRMVRAMQRDLYRDQDVQSIEHYMDASIITNGLSRAFSTEAWSHPFKRMERISGVVVTLRQTNPLQTTTKMRKTRHQVSYTGRVGDARYQHPSHWGKICFLNTSDGENCGLVKNLSSLDLVSTCILEQDRIVDKLYECRLETLLDDTSTALNEKDKIFVDGDWVGLCTDSTSFVAKLRHKRRKMEVPHQIEIKRDQHHGEVRIFTDAGRILRPLLVVWNLKKIRDLKGEIFHFNHF